MKSGNVTKMGPSEFLELASRCGLTLTEVDLAQMARRKLIVSFGPDDGESWYTELHLYVVAKYFQAVRPLRHPWATKAADTTLDQVAALASRVNRFLESTLSSDGDGPGKEDTEFIVGVERFLARIDPFGPLGDVFSLLQPRVIAKMRNEGRLYLEIKGAVSELSTRLHTDSQEVPSQQAPRTKQLYGLESVTPKQNDEVRSTQVIGEGAGETSEAAREAIDEVISAAESDVDDVDEDDGDQSQQAPEQEPEVANAFADDPETQIIEVLPERNADAERADKHPETKPKAKSIPKAESSANGAESSQTDESSGPKSIPQAEPAPDLTDELIEEDSEPIVLLEEELDAEEADLAPAASEDSSPPAKMNNKQTRELDKRLEKFSRDASKTTKKKVVIEDMPAATPPPSPVERIAELNRRREVYMKEQAWDELVELYEDGIGLFTDPDERQQIFLVLAMLYEVKLRDKQKAFDTFARAWSERDGDASRSKAFEGLTRLGKSSSLHDRYIDWLQQALAGSLTHDERVRLQKELALGLFADEKYDLAFSSYAAFLAEAPEKNVSTDRLNQLELLGEHVAPEEVEAFFDDLRQRELNSGTRELVEEFAAQSAE